jgi:hypothetical protein
MSNAVKQPAAKADAEREALRRRLLELILKNETRRQMAMGKRAGE